MIAAGESAWYARRVLRGDRWSDPAGSRVDAATALGIVLLGHLNLEHADRPTWINWPPWTLAANVICGQAMGVAPAGQAIAGAAAVIGAHATQSRRARDALAMRALASISKVRANAVGTVCASRFTGACAKPAGLRASSRHQAPAPGSR
jgi:hypothetical protein